eukprot:TRINITY_DN10469_c0_g1_i1.p1 TRINITY_DN10469_c0_g1~~TRINITY_DN10469_c0_g1_i1.p1  ORF type:complete len:216 (-),score=24.85 TRINITY_DN10469_c0_g1_i1:77-724(-)
MPRCPKCKSKNAEGYNFCSQCGHKNEETSKSSCTYHFVVMGSGGVGKSAITIRFVNRQFEAKYDPTIEDRYQKVIDYQGVPCVLEILDTAGQETFSAMRELYMKNGEGFVLVYSITSQRSLEDLDPIRNGIIRHKSSTEVPIVLVGNKCDLVKKREVEQKEGKEIAREYNCPFLEASAKGDINITETFHSLIEQIWQKNGPPTSGGGGKKGCTIL